MICRSILRTPRRSLRLPASRRALTFSYNRQAADNISNPFGSGPAPPRLPKEEQEIFEKLQKQSTGAFSTPRAPPKVNQSPDSQVAAAQQESSPSSTGQAQDDELYPHLRQTVKPEFEGDTNPKTGEVGGPKNEPLRWGHNGDWSYNGRVTDF